MIFPDLQRSLQYLQVALLQKENPRSLLSVPKYFLGGWVVTAFGCGLEFGFVVFRNLSRVVCRGVADVPGVGVGVTAICVFGVGV